MCYLWEEEDVLKGGAVTTVVGRSVQQNIMHNCTESTAWTYMKFGGVAKKRRVHLSWTPLELPWTLLHTYLPGFNLPNASIERPLKDTLSLQRHSTHPLYTRHFTVHWESCSVEKMDSWWTPLLPCILHHHKAIADNTMSCSTHKPWRGFLRIFYLFTKTWILCPTIVHRTLSIKDTSFLRAN